MNGITRLIIREFPDGDGNLKEYVSLTAYRELEGQLQAASDEVRQLQKGRNLSDAEYEEIGRLRKEWLEMKAEADRIALFIRSNYQQEIELGQHAQMKTAADAALFYMGKERLMARKGGS